MNDAPFHATRDGAVLEVTLTRGKANAIDAATSRLLGDTFAAFRDDPFKACQQFVDARRRQARKHAMAQVGEREDAARNSHRGFSNGPVRGDDGQKQREEHEDSPADPTRLGRRC